MMLLMVPGSSVFATPAPSQAPLAPPGPRPADGSPPIPPTAGQRHEEGAERFALGPLFTQPSGIGLDFSF
ncbi:hypothetical protein GCM10027447_00750 [Glycomyces halotolerans]